MELKDRVVAVDEMNMTKSSRLYGELNIDELGHIVNKHLGVYMDEIEEDIAMENRVPHCSECEFLKYIDYAYKNYYCDHEDRENDMGYVGVDNPPKTSPVWCPKRGGLDNGK